MAVNFKLISEFQTIHRRPFGLAVPATLKPSNVRPLVDGEFLQLDAAYKMARGGNNSAGAADEDIADVPSFAFFAESGRSDTQAVEKGPFLFGNFYEADTIIMDAAAAGGISAVGQALFVGDVDIGGIVRRGLMGALGTPAGTEKVVGYVTRLPASNRGYLRFIRA